MLPSLNPVSTAAEFPYGCEAVHPLREHQHTVSAAAQTRIWPINGLESVMTPGHSDPQNPSEGLY